MVTPLGSLVAGLGPQTNAAAQIGDIFRQSRVTNSNLQSADLQRQYMQQNMGMQQENQAAQRKQLSQQEALQAATYVNKLGKRLLATDESQWNQILQPQLPALQALGYDPRQLSGMTREQIQSVVAQTDPLVAQQGQGEQFTLSPGQVRFDSQGRPIAGVEQQADPEKTQPLVDKLRSRYDSYTKDLRSVDAAYKKITTAPETAAGDMAMIFNYMKLLDPGSTVREGEFASAQQAAGVPSRVLNLYNRALSGERLTPEQREDFRKTGESAFVAQRESADQQIATILQQADQDNIPRAKVLGEEGLREFEKRAADRMIQQNQKRLKYNPQTNTLE